MKPTHAFLFLTSVATLPLLGGCSPDAYRRQADEQVYRILRDRKRDTLGYDPQAVVGRAAVRDDAPGAASAAEAKADAASKRGPAVVPAPGAGAVPAGAYEAIPATTLAPPQPAPWNCRRTWTCTGRSGRSPTARATRRSAGRRQRRGLGDVRFGPAGHGGVVAAARRPAGNRRRVQARLVYRPSAPGPAPVVLDLFASLAYGVQHSRAYRDQMDELYLGALDVTLQRHLFEPRPFAQVGLQYTGGQSDVAYKSALTATVNAGVRQQLPYGGEIVASTLVSFVRAVSDNAQNGESAQVALSGSLPLLRGAGLVNLEPLIASERELVYKVRDFENFRRQYALDTSTAYFRLLTALQSVNNRRLNVQNLAQLLERTRRGYAQAPVGLKGRLGFLEVQRSEQSLLAGQDDLARSQQQYLNTLDIFKILIGMDVRQEVNVVPVALDVAVPELESRDVIELADRYRLDLQTARDQVNDARRQIAVAQNGLLPDLNLTAQGRRATP